MGHSRLELPLPSLARRTSLQKRAVTGSGLDGMKTELYFNFSSVFPSWADSYGVVVFHFL